MIDENARLRQKMVDEQIIHRGVCQGRLIAALRKIPRHMFVPTYSVKEAYEDRPLPIEDGQTISQPYIVAYMSEILNIKKTDKILEIGTGSGYQTALLAELSNHVYTIEGSSVLSDQARAILKSLGYYHVSYKKGDGYYGWMEYAPFDKIIITCASSVLPPQLLKQLNDPGRAVIPLNQAHMGFQWLTLFEKENNIISSKQLMAVRFVPMIDEEGNPY